jgi:hypothetical protein
MALGSSFVLSRHGSVLCEVYIDFLNRKRHQIVWFYSVAVITSGSDPSSFTRRAWTVRATPVRFRVRPKAVLCFKVSFCLSARVTNDFFPVFLGVFDPQIDRKRPQRS